ncbi:phage antirepressor KilAC domain-containing protein [Holzapfeliella sp. JNUCC 80]
MSKQGYEMETGLIQNKFINCVKIGNQTFFSASQVAKDLLGYAGINRQTIDKRVSSENVKKVYINRIKSDMNVLNLMGIYELAINSDRGSNELLSWLSGQLGLEIQRKEATYSYNNQELKPKEFKFNGFEVTAFEIEGEPYFLGAELTKLLGYSNDADALSKHVRDRDKLNIVKRDSKFRGYPFRTAINEPGLYDLIRGSHLPGAERFKYWVSHEVLPSIRKTGTYMTDSAIDKILEDPDSFIKVLNEYKKEKEQRLLAQQQVKELQPKATYYDLILQNKSLLSVTQIAKDYGMSAKKLNSLLNEFKVQFKQGKTWILYAKYQDKGYTQTATYAVDSEYSKPLTKWTQKGRLFLYDLLKNHGIVPKIEQEQAS